jgi:hypothetical protein
MHEAVGPHGKACVKRVGSALVEPGCEVYHPGIGHCIFVRSNPDGLYVRVPSRIGVSFYPLGPGAVYPEANWEFSASAAAVRSVSTKRAKARRVKGLQRGRKVRSNPRRSLSPTCCLQVSP